MIVLIIKVALPSLMSIGNAVIPVGKIANKLSRG
jgi:hypothetical protein